MLKFSVSNPFLTTEVISGHFSVTEIPHLELTGYDESNYTKNSCLQPWQAELLRCQTNRCIRTLLYEISKFLSLTWNRMKIQHSNEVIFWERFSLCMSHRITCISIHKYGYMPNSKRPQLLNLVLNWPTHY